MSTKDRSSHSQEMLLPKWANSQDSWIRTIVSDVLSSRVQCADSDIDHYLQLLLAEKKLSEDPFEPSERIEEKQLDGSPLDPVRLDSLKVGDGVNAIKIGSQIEFAAGVTVIFGENGSGKSGFVRLLKRAAGVRTAEDILPDIRGSARPTPSATFVVTVGSTSTPVEWKNEFGIAPLSRASVFDTRGARLHVEEDLNYLYTPGELTLLPFVQNAIERVRAALDRAIAARAPGANTFLASFDRTSSIYGSIETLSAATDVEEIRRCALLPENIDSRIESLRTEIDALKSTAVQNELKRARDRLAVVQRLKSALQAIRLFDPYRYAVCVEAWNRAKHQRDSAGYETFKHLGIPGVLTEEWRAFIQAGEAYLRKHIADGYPHTADPCAYCQQPLTGRALELLEKYRDFANNSTKIALANAEREFRDYIAPMVSLNADVLHGQLLAETSEGDDVLKPVVPLVAHIKAVVASTAAASAISWPDKDANLTAAEEIVSAEWMRLTGLISTLQTSIEQRHEILSKKQSDLVELQSKQTLHDLLPQIERRVSEAKWSSRASIIKNSLSGILRSLTDTAKGASEVLLNKGFVKRFEDECRRLRAPNVTLHFPGRQGQVTRRKTVAAHKPNQVLSEGEQKALALADFLAEVTAVPASCPVIFDDPITSMDYRRIHEVCDRIVTLAADHQIILFTHNIWFAAELLAKADKKTWKYYDIRSEDGRSGVLSSAIHPRVDTIAQVGSRVKKIIEGAEKAEGEIRAALVEKGYEELRGLCEIVVEHELLKGVVQRYAPNVMMTKMEKINVDKLQESTSVVVPIFEKSCRYIASHSQPIETQGIRPTLDELKSDHFAVLKAREAHKE